MNVATGSVSRTRPPSTSVITLVVVATTLVSDARSKIVSSVIASAAGATARLPNARWYRIWSPRPTSTTAPGSSWRAIASSTSGAIGANAALESGARAGACAAAGPERTRAIPASAAARVFTESIQYILSAVITLAGSEQGFSGGICMRYGLHLSRGVLAAFFVAALAGNAAAQTGRVGGTVKDEAGQPIKGATVTAENPNASPSSFTATTDDKGRFSIIGLRTGRWTFTAQAPSFAPESGGLNVQTIGAPNPPLTFTLKKGGSTAPAGALGGLAAKDLQADLAAADQLYNSQQWDQAITA